MDVSEEASRTLVWSGGSFSATVSKRLPVMQVLMMHSEDEDDSSSSLGLIGSKSRPLEAASVTCEFVLAKTPYREVRWQRVPQLPLEFRSTEGAIATNANCCTTICFCTLYQLTVFSLIIFIHLY